MSEAIALSSPSGRMSKRARAAAEKRLVEALFGPGGATREAITGGALPTPLTKRECLLRRAADLRELAARGMCVRKYTRKAAEYEARAAALAP
jgi:hypothetical protein